MKSLLVLCLLTCALQVNASVGRSFVGDRSFVGEGTWSDNAEQRGVITSRLYFGWLGGAKVDYDVEFDRGGGLRLQVIVQPRRDGSCRILTLEKERIGTCRVDEETSKIILSFTQDGAQLEIWVDFFSSEDSIGVVAKKTTSDGLIITWNDALSEASE